MKVRCKYWRDCNVPGGGCCTLGHYGGRPSLGTCGLCPHYHGTPRGLGDCIHLFAHPLARWLERAFRIRRFSSSRCGCGERRKRWNRLNRRRRK